MTYGEEDIVLWVRGTSIGIASVKDEYGQIVIGRPFCRLSATRRKRKVILNIGMAARDVSHHDAVSHRGSCRMQREPRRNPKGPDAAPRQGGCADTCSEDGQYGNHTPTRRVPARAWHNSSAGCRIRRYGLAISSDLGTKSLLSIACQSWFALDCPSLGQHDIRSRNWLSLPAHPAGAKRMSRVIKMSTPKPSRSACPRRRR